MCGEHSCPSGTDPEFAVDGAYVTLDGIDRDCEVIGDLLEVAQGGELFEDLAFAGAEADGLGPGGYDRR